MTMSVSFFCVLTKLKPVILSNSPHQIRKQYEHVDRTI